ncbi:Sodium-dependent phosphate transport protein 2B [Halotydeus destructor]|nr:Sodium-dependent phosphate transport protein 2B [Halotydeus destructor]
MNGLDSSGLKNGTNRTANLANGKLAASMASSPDSEDSNTDLMVNYHPQVKTQDEIRSLFSHDLKPPSGRPSEGDTDGSVKVKQVLQAISKAIALVILMYIFICSLELLSSAFRLLGGKAAGRVISNSELLKNPIVGLMMGVLVTVLVQSSSTSTSIVVTMVGSDLIRVRQAIPIVMGANIGTSVTNTIVSLMQASDRDEFRRAFAAATVHDMFNWLTVIVLLPIEVGFGFLETTTDKIMSLQDWQQDKQAKQSPGFLKRLTRPVTESIVKLDKNVLNKLGTGGNETLDDDSVRILQQCCKMQPLANGTQCVQSCSSILNSFDLSDNVAGVLLLIASLFCLCGCLVLLVKLLNSVLQGRIAVIIKKYINNDYQFPYSIFIGYIAIVVGCLMTILVQSSSIFTSALTPLAGIGVISLERIYPLTLGSNIGTTTTGILAALAADRRSLRNTLQLAFCHLLFNISGILLFYPIPYTRFPIPFAKLLGNTTAKYRWFSILYLLLMFFLLPLIVFSLSWAGKWYFIGIGGPLLAVIFLASVVNLVQAKHPSWLPLKYQNWNWLPLWMHSLDPVDKLIIKFAEKFTCLQCCIQSENRHDGDAMGIRANQSQLHILEAANKSAFPSEAHLMNAYDNDSCFVNWATNGQSLSSPTSKAESTHL